VAIHRAANGVDVGFNHVLSPGGIDPEHRGDAVAVLLGDPQRIFAGHQVPAHRRVPGHVWSPIPQFQRHQGCAPSSCLDLQVQEGLACFAEEDVVVLDETGSLKPGPQRELPFENSQCSRAKSNPPIVAGLSSIAVNSRNPRLVDADDPVHQVDIGEYERNLFRRPHSCEETELVVVSLRLSPVSINRSDEGLGILNAKRINPGTLGLSQTRATETAGWVVLLRMIAVPEVERASQNADRVVVRLLAPPFGIRNLN
jgi:hypothetical protein